MSLVNNKSIKKRWIKALWNFTMFFLLIGFVVTCNFVLFLHSVNMEEAEIRAAAPITFLNVVLLSFLFSVIDVLRRMWMVNRPVRRINAGIRKIIAGDFHTRIPYIKGEDSDNEFDHIIKGLNEMAAELS